ncbi:universal stress protein [Lysobacter sp. A3-1-A15]|uniref:universal stress protein n=1 Tax=Novilysobacter viscosus TaxID=3098602 RepID=UPI002ED8157B
MKILLAVDGSDMALRATRHVVALAKAMAKPPSIHLLHADPPLLPDASRQLGPDATARYHRENSEYATRRARTALRRAGLAFNEVHAIAEPAEAVIKQVRAGKCDLIVMGSHGRSALKSALLGSVTAKVLAHCQTPVTVVR